MAQATLADATHEAQALQTAMKVSVAKVGQHHTELCYAGFASTTYMVSYALQDIQGLVMLSKSPAASTLVCVLWS